MHYLINRDILFHYLDKITKTIIILTYVRLHVVYMLYNRKQILKLITYVVNMIRSKIEH